MIIITTTMLLISSLLILLNLWLPTIAQDTEKLSPYECGFDPLGTAHVPFSLQFFLIAIMFLLFDLEIALLLPLPWAMNNPTPTTTLTWTLLIIIILLLGFIYEWTQGGLEWAE
uniref:NADH dehydrogenase subunit 3 n=1 Tax=Aspidoscelis inornatus TaxID=68352 RepID=UPI0021FC8692|nr:NADH dehydrogenase subunit 3 [Aspidoscelis inornatus]UXX18187.1 NADH dehydrogenase subunit 3 [Aspidoscelis inornatus]UXX18200.1 NADH dehydrogenase subunit 3 [Aspidoscelis inornatus]UXX18213.1 NADH dehydrogenase subunit 3 [Aspidoscelis inornatus]UXX18226.1 NADH dehydrogenase subunit 3 [Aspidoscelis inornatus]UXX18239.1 NADH dehydrogenase subunit 3 [Aspidoscelis inornatus]